MSNYDSSLLKKLKSELKTPCQKGNNSKYQGLPFLLVSQSNLTLLRGVELFDWSRDAAPSLMVQKPQSRRDEPSLVREYWAVAHWSKPNK